MPAIGLGVVESPRDCDALRKGSEIVVIDQHWGALPARARVLEASDQLPLLGVDADGRGALALETPAHAVDVFELLISKGTGCARDLLVIDAQGEFQAPEQACDGLGRHHNAGLTQFTTDLQSRLACPLQAVDWVARSVVLH